MEEDMELERKAVEELLKEAKRGKTRAETMGAMGWMKCPLAGTNKRFLINTIKNTLPSQKEQVQEHEQEEEEDSKPPEPSESRKEEKPKKHRTYPYTPSFRPEEESAILLLGTGTGAGTQRISTKSDQANREG
ncbi:protein POLR1D [Dermochelys coriacea]|uniref:protein POLR1D n=1 Tax=Dermochelys coriacea TaxID=27794 RepID=UPI0018E8B8FE|nr:protein POLR1D [Dermochelys coriacea]